MNPIVHNGCDFGLRIEDKYKHAYNKYIVHTIMILTFCLFESTTLHSKLWIIAKDVSDFVRNILKKGYEFLYP